MKSKLINVLYYSGIMYILFYINLLLLSSLLFIVNFKISIVHTIVSIILSCIELFFMNKKKKKNNILSIGLFFLVFIISILWSNHFYDTSYDGNSYHKEAIGLLSKGWNPVYESSEVFAKKNDYVSFHSLWLDHYPKSTWIYGANIYKWSGNIESAKSYNFMIVYTVFVVILGLLFKKRKSLLMASTLAIISSISPIFIEQIFSLYVDGFLGGIVLLTLVFMYRFIKEDRDIEVLTMLGSLLVILVNIKFTGIMYGGVFCLGYFLYYSIKLIKSKETKRLLQSVLFFIGTLMVGLLLVGNSSYVRNTLDHKNPLYPLIGEEDVDIMTYLQPASFADMSPIEKNYYSIFSKSANIGVFNNGEPQIKIPFTYDSWELTQFSEDTRIGGFGVLFSGLFIISFIVIIIYIIKDLIKKEKDSIIMIGIPFVTILIMLFAFSEGWWARYSPHLYFLVIMAIYLLFNNKKKLSTIFAMLLSLVVLFNSTIVVKSIFQSKIPKSGSIRISLENHRNEKMSVYLPIKTYTGLLYNLEDYGIDYKLVKDNTNMKDLYSNLCLFREKDEGLYEVFKIDES